MLDALIAVAVVALSAVTLVMMQARRAERRARSSREGRSQAERRAAQSDAELADVRAQLATTRAGAETLRAELSAARAEIDAARIRVRNAQRRPAGRDGRIDALWALGDLETRRSGYVSIPSAPNGPSGEAARPDPLELLQLSLRAEVTRIREEIGTPGELEIGQLQGLDRGDSLVLVRATQALLAALARHCDAYDLRVEQDTTEARAVVTCERWEGPDRSADDMSALLSALEPVGADLDLDRDEAGRLRASLNIPVTPTK